ncbi:hypothetical protein BKH42_03425 [Helicobacter sp. 13S00482-2]|uniref:hypothetical protein n=1 Tax=Helicobacter sp. 13S00482-2 TaxID=1476200 RepID=UPI000BA4F80E|nr:hypothetical protein [Helicobacter sp. 13S00482-2]PAF54028.1 hypothetical protein BKH42_03425 [Helicobacter sp. 13S00482-2]
MIFIISVLFLFPIINLIFFCIDNKISRLDKIISIILIILFIIFGIYSLVYDYICFLFVFTLLSLFLLLFIYIKIKNKFKNININEINMIIYFITPLPFLFDGVCGSYCMTLVHHFTIYIWVIIFSILMALYALVFLINIIVRLVSFIKKRRNKIKEGNPHDEPKNPETVKILENVIKQRRGE